MTMALKVKLVKNQAMSNIDLSRFDDGKSINLTKNALLQTIFVAWNF